MGIQGTAIEILDLFSSLKMLYGMKLNIISSCGYIFDICYTYILRIMYDLFSNTFYSDI